MKYFLLVALYAVAVPASGNLIVEHVNGKDGWYVPQRNGTDTWVDMADIMEQIRSSSDDPNTVKFYLSTTANNEPLEIGASTDFINDAQFNGQNPTRIFIPGWDGHKENSIYTAVRDAWLSTGEYNYIFVEWDRAFSNDYVSGFSAVPGVGIQVAALVDFLVDNGNLELSTLIIIGFSLGAHIAGHTGKNIASGGKVGTIVGLDPSLALFNDDQPNIRLCSTDADYVESIHTSVYGFLLPIGKIDFYPNGGQSQPNCEDDMCSHFRAITYYAEAVVNDNFPTIMCAKYDNAVVKSCGFMYSCVRMCSVSNTVTDTGVFFVPVNNISPYGISV